jgi:hypothetical protein
MDRLPALAGIASELSILSGDQYIAGIWKTNLVQYLDWYARNPSRTHSQSFDLQLPPSGGGPCLPLIENYRSPSWSWISYGHPVLISEPRDSLNSPLDEYALPLSCEIELMTPDVPFGCVKSGKLVLSTACVGESERRQMFLGGNLWHRFDHERRYRRQDEYADLDTSLQYAYLGSRKDGWASALILAPTGDGTFMGIGLLHLRDRGSLASWVDRSEDNHYNLSWRMRGRFERELGHGTKKGNEEGAKEEGWTGRKTNLASLELCRRLQLDLSNLLNQKIQQ